MDVTPVRPLAVVTGASSGIGYELAVRFAQAGRDHVVAGSLRNKVQAAVSKIVPEAAKARMQARMTEPGHHCDDGGPADGLPG